jgi:hypothetical protein
MVMAFIDLAAALFELALASIDLLFGWVGRKLRR